MDVTYLPEPFGGGSEESSRVHCGEGFPTKGEFLDLILPRCKINMHNPELNGVSGLPPQNQQSNGEVSQTPNGKKKMTSKTPTAKRTTRSSGTASDASTSPAPGAVVINTSEELPRRKSPRGKAKIEEPVEEMEVVNSNEVRCSF